MSNSNYSIGLQRLKPVHTAYWPARFGRKLVLGTRRKWPRPRRLPPETETLTIFLKEKPRRVVGTSRDRERDHNSASELLLINDMYFVTGSHVCWDLIECWQK